MYQSSSRYLPISTVNASKQQTLRSVPARAGCNLTNGSNSYLKFTQTAASGYETQWSVSRGGLRK